MSFILRTLLWRINDDDDDDYGWNTINLYGSLKLSDAVSSYEVVRRPAVVVGG